MHILVIMARTNKLLDSSFTVFKKESNARVYSVSMYSLFGGITKKDQGASHPITFEVQIND
jgi:hypothetical protein